MRVGEGEETVVGVVGGVFWLTKSTILTTLIDTAECHMCLHMERLPQRPGVIDSLQSHTHVGTLTNKRRPINIGGADQTEDGEGRCGGGAREWGEGQTRKFFVLISSYKHQCVFFLNQFNSGLSKPRGCQTQGPRSKCGPPGHFCFVRGSVFKQTFRGDICGVIQQNGPRGATVVCVLALQLEGRGIDPKVYLLCWS